MTERFAVALNRGSIRIYQHSQPVGQQTPGLQPVHQLDVPAGRAKFNHYSTDQAGRHPSQPQQGGTYKGMSIDERLPEEQEHEKRVFDEVAREVEAFFKAHPQAEWDFAAPPGVHQAVLGRLSAGLRGRIRRALTKDLTNLPPVEVRQHFTG